MAGSDDSCRKVFNWGKISKEYGFLDFRVPSEAKQREVGEEFFVWRVS